MHDGQKTGLSLVGSAGGDGDGPFDAADEVTHVIERREPFDEPAASSVRLSDGDSEMVLVLARLLGYTPTEVVEQALLNLARIVAHLPDDREVAVVVLGVKPLVKRIAEVKKMRREGN
jgi:hypothetical protein